MLKAQADALRQTLVAKVSRLLIPHNQECVRKTKKQIRKYDSVRDRIGKTALRRSKLAAKDVSVHLPAGVNGQAIGGTLQVIAKVSLRRKEVTELRGVLEAVEHTEIFKIDIVEAVNTKVLEFIARGSNMAVIDLTLVARNIANELKGAG